MQYQKQEVRARIISVATDVFCAVGYDAASMLRISTEARVPIGNLYRYFPSKNALFKEIVGDAHRAVMECVRRVYETEYARVGEEPFAFGMAESIAVALSDTVKEYEKPIYILAKMSAGSEYATFNKDVAELVFELCKTALYGASLNEDDALMCSIIADNLTDGMFRVFLDSPTDEWAKRIKKLLVFYFDRVEERLR